MTVNRFASLVFTGVWISCCLTLVVGMSACRIDPCHPRPGVDACNAGADEATTENAGDIGGDEIVVDLPFAEGEGGRCTQGVGGSYSHDGTSTLYAVDIDTPNDAEQELYVPAGGTAYVHTESATSGFGYHVRVDVGDGRSVVIAHLSEVLVADGEEVAAGQLLGYEGCTGACTGDHVHVGMLEGDPADMAQFGTSVEAFFRAADMDAEDMELAAVAGSDFVCGTDSGHVYASGLPVARWHPDGTLVKVPNDPKTYRVEGGAARHIANESTFWSHGFDFDDLALISDEELACLGTGDAIDAEGEIDVAYDADETAWLLVTDTDGARWKQRVPSDAREHVLASWGTSGDALATNGELSENDLGRYDTRSGTAPFRDGAILKESSRSDVYVVSNGTALPVKDWDTYLLIGFGARSILTVDDGDVEAVMGDAVGSCAAGVWCLDAEAVTTCGGGLELGSGNAGGSEVGEEEDEGEDEAETAGDTAEEAVDRDGDGTPDADDNCPLHDNADQGDLDGDGTGDSCDADADGDGVANGSDCDLFDAAVRECEEEVAADSASGEEPEPVDTAADAGEESDSGEPEADEEDPWSVYVYLSDPYVCFSSEGFRTPYDNADAYTVGYGTSLDWTLDPGLLAGPDAVDAGYVCVDTTGWAYDDYELTLLSSIRSDGSAATTYLDTGDWWDNYDYCASGSDASSAFCVSQGGYDYLVGVSKTTSGLFPNGDGA